MGASTIAMPTAVPWDITAEAHPNVDRDPAAASPTSHREPYREQHVDRRVDFGPTSYQEPPVDLPADLELPTPQWILDATAERDRADLAVAARGGFSLRNNAAMIGMAAMELCDPVELAANGHGRAVLDGIVAAQRMIAHVQAIQQRWIAAFAEPGVAAPVSDAIASATTELTNKFGIDIPTTPDGDIGEPAALADPFIRPAVADQVSRIASAEIACATRLSPVTARIRVSRARTMVNTLPATLAAQQSGDLDGYRAAIIADGLATLPVSLQTAVEREILATANRCTAAELRRRVARAVIAADPAGAAERSELAVKSRSTSVTAIEDDMALFQAVLTAPDALVANGVLDAIATSLKASGLADGRTAANLRADAFADLFHSLARNGHAHVEIPASEGFPGQEHERVDARHGDGGRVVTGIESCHCGGIGGDRLPDPGSRSSAVATGGRSVAGWSGLPGPSSPTVGPVSAPRVRLNVYIGADTLAGLNDLPGEISGYGVVSAGTARALAASAATIRAIVTQPAPCNLRATATDSSAAATPAVFLPVAASGRSTSVGTHATGNTARSRACGTVVDPGRAVYRPPEATADFVRARDRHCQFPGCHIPAERCDIDHRVPFERGGATCPCNLDVLCRTHHRLKTFTSWRAEPDAAGRLVWTSPLGHTYPLMADMSLARATPAANSGHNTAPVSATDPPPF